MSATSANVGGGEFDLCVVGATAFGCAVAREAAVRGLRTLLLAHGDIAESVAGRLPFWLPALVDAEDAAAADAARADREMLLRSAPHLVRPVRVVVAPTDRRTSSAARNVGSTLPAAMPIDEADVRRAAPFLPAASAARAMLAFDGACDEAGLARALARAAAQAGAVVWTRASVVGGTVQGIEAIDADAAASARFRATETLVAQGFLTAAAALHVDVGDRLAQFDELVASRDGGASDVALMLGAAGGWFAASPAMSHGVWRPSRGSSVDDAAELLAAIGLRRDIDHAVVRRHAPAAPIEEQAVVGRVHMQHVDAVASIGAARSFVRRVFPAAAASGDRPLAFGSGPQEPLDPVWRRHGAESASVRSLAHADAGLRSMLCPHLGVLAAEVAHAVRHDFAGTFADVLRRVFLPDPCLEPGCLRHALGVYQRLRGEVSDPAADMRAILDPIRRWSADPDATARGRAAAGIVRP